MKSKQTLVTELQELHNVIYDLKSAQKTEIRHLEIEKYLPLIEQADKIKQEIYTTVTNKYKPDLAELNQRAIELEDSIDALKVEEATNLWHPVGTIVTLWQRANYSNTVKKTDKTGTVVIYDGRQSTPQNMYSGSLPRKGDVVVFHNRKDGTVGLKFDIIARNGIVNSYYPMWLTKEETPTDNFKTKMKEKENIQGITLE